MFRQLWKTSASINMLLLWLSFCLIVSIRAQLVPRLDGKIVGGQAVDIEQFPYQVSLQVLNNHICGGAIIHKKYILTAAHCTVGLNEPRYFNVRAGSTYHNSGGQNVKVNRIFQHKLFNTETVDYDISILELENELKLGVSVQIIGLPYWGYVIPERIVCAAAGWGASSEDGSVLNRLHAIFIPTINKKKCQAAYAEYQLSKFMFCAGLIDVGKKDTCQGDSGGPLVYQGNVIGIVSWGYGCARPKHPGVYTYVSRLRSFIDPIIYK